MEAMVTLYVCFFLASYVLWENFGCGWLLNHGHATRMLSSFDGSCCIDWELWQRNDIVSVPSVRDFTSNGALGDSIGVCVLGTRYVLWETLGGGWALNHGYATRVLPLWSGLC